jgi:hypothetical protein
MIDRFPSSSAWNDALCKIGFPYCFLDMLLAVCILWVSIAGKRASYFLITFIVFWCCWCLADFQFLSIHQSVFFLLQESVAEAYSFLQLVDHWIFSEIRCSIYLFLRTMYTSCVTVCTVALIVWLAFPVGVWFVPTRQSNCHKSYLRPYEINFWGYLWIGCMANLHFVLFCWPGSLC